MGTIPTWMNTGAGINRNMRCIEIVVTVVDGRFYDTINRNMRCIEMLIMSVAVLFAYFD